VSEFSSIWLRDNSPANRDPSNGQRLVDIVEVSPDLRIESATLHPGTVLVQWEADAQATAFELSWLALNVPGGDSLYTALFRPHAWLQGASLDASRDFAWITAEEMRAAPVPRLAWLGRLLREGMAFMRDLPREAGAILQAIEPIGRVLETNYGEVFDVRSVPQPENLAYSDLGLGLHTDNPYREPVPGFQALHVISASPDGGESLFADGFAIAEHLRAVAPQAFEMLTQTAVPFLYRSKDAELYAERPFIQLSCDGAVVAIHYNNRSIAPMRLPAARMEKFYASYRAFAELLRDSRYQLRFRLRDGDLVAFDNRRILHGRTAFSSARFLRHLQGCYLTRDSVYSEAAMLHRKLADERRA
jgi:gamma-butyrobetaine dioxygenase